MSFENELKHYLDSAMPHYASQLRELVKIPSISNGTTATLSVDAPISKVEEQKERRASQRRVVATMQQILDKTGFKTRVVETGGNPLLVASLKGKKGSPLINIYNHLDTQPVVLSEWKTDPFNPAVNLEKIVGRGATDDKGPALAIIYAINFLKIRGYDLPNIQVTYETEEEIGSPNFESGLKKALNLRLIKKPDSILISDTVFLGDQPAITYRLRGAVNVALTLTTADKDIHSGRIGGVSNNPIKALNKLLSQFEDDSGKILIPGFYSGMVKPTPREIANLKSQAKTFDVNKFKDDLGAYSLATEDPFEVLLRTGCMPSFEIMGYTYGQSEVMKKGVIVSSATAHLSFRIVPGQEPSDIVRKVIAYAQKIDSRVTGVGHGPKAAITDIDNEYIALAKQACKLGFGKDAVLLASGGTIGSVPVFLEKFGSKTPVAMIAQSLSSDGYHAPNEEFKLSQAAAGIKTMAFYLNSIANLK